MTHSVVFYQPGRFGGWPANCGIWSWASEILVSYHVGPFLADARGHRVDPDSIVAGFSRSLDGGLTWTVEPNLDEIFSRPARSVPAGGFEVDNPDFALRVGRPSIGIRSELYLVSNDRGRTWDGPFALPGFGHPLTPRTCYLVEGPGTVRIFLSHQLANTRGTTYTDRAFTALTRDGGRTWQFVGDMTHDVPRSVMPDVVRLADGTLVAALRRRLESARYPAEELATYTRMPWRDDNWIEVRRSADQGRTWTHPVRAAETSHHWGRNGNPPALCRLADDTLVLVYGYRGEPPSIRCTVSRDGGHTFGPERLLRDDALMHDLGYPRLAVRPDGRCVAAYYTTTVSRPENHIEATVFEPDAL